MGLPKTITWKVYTAVLGAVTTLAAQKLVSGAWKLTTGDEPPTPTDPDTPLGVALSWALASAIGVGVVQLVTLRYTTRRAAEDSGQPKNTTKLKLMI